MTKFGGGPPRSASSASPVIAVYVDHTIRVNVPEVPEYLSLVGGAKIDIGSLSDDSITKVVEAWVSNFRHSANIRKSNAMLNENSILLSEK